MKNPVNKRIVLAESQRKTIINVQGFDQLLQGFGVFAKTMEIKELSLEIRN